MLAVHAVWSCPAGDGGVVRLWGEDASLAAGSGAAAVGSSSGTWPDHPFGASAGLLGEGLATLGIASSGTATMTLLLPGSRSRPRPSPTVARLAAARYPKGRPTLRPWTVPAITLDAAAVLDLADRFAGLASPPPGTGVAAGPSLPWFAAVGGVALDLVARGRVLPAVVTGAAGGPEARWLPVPTPDDIACLRNLAGALPASVRAEASPDGSRRAPEPAVVLDAALAAVVDAAARTALAGVRLVPPRRGQAPATRPAGERLIGALGSPDAVLEGDAEETEKLRRALADWLRSGEPAAGPLRTCFRLVPPPDDDDEDDDGSGSGHADSASDWRVEFLLQSTADPTLLVPADEVWQAGPGLRSLRHDSEHPAQHLLADLGRAVRLYPELEAALDLARPDGLDVDTTGAHRFLGEVAPLLEQAGFGVLVPPWWRSPAGRLGLRLRAQPRPAPDLESSSGLLGLDGLCDYRYDVALGGEVLSKAELADLARCKAPLVRMRGRWVELHQGQVKAALALLRRTEKSPGQMTAAEVLRVGLGLEPAPDAPLPVTDVDAGGWIGALLAPDGDRRLEPVPTPASFAGELRPYQQRGLAWLRFLDRLGLGACLADDMGLGKTAQLLALLAAERDGPSAGTDPPAPGTPRPPGRRRAARLRPTLLVCPMSVVGNWQREAARFTPGLAVHVHHGATRETGTAFARAARQADLVITTYALVARDRELLAKVRWGRVALDEAQNVKNHTSQAARAVRLLPAGSRVALTGTPVENRLLELWSLMDFLNPGLLGSEAAFRRAFAVPIERFRDDDAARTLKRLTGPFALRRLKTDRAIITDLPDKIEMKVLTNLTREQASLYQAVVDDMLVRLETAEAGIERMGIISASMIKLKQVCNHPAHLLGDGSRLPGRSGKLARLDELLEEITAGGERALCFTQFAEMGHLLQGHLAGRLGRDVPFLHGGVPKRARDEMVARFSDADGPPVLLLSLKAGGVGLNLTAANHVIHFDRWWNPAVEDQATDRAFRIGQRKDVQVRKFVCVGTLEERIDAMIEDKRDLAARIVGTGEAWLHDLSLTQLRDLVALSDDAVAED